MAIEIRCDWCGDLVRVCDQVKRQGGSSIVVSRAVETAKDDEREKLEFVHRWNNLHEKCHDELARRLAQTTKVVAVKL